MGQGGLRRWKVGNNFATLALIANLHCKGMFATHIVCKSGTPHNEGDRRLWHKPLQTYRVAPMQTCRRHFASWPDGPPHVSSNFPSHDLSGCYKLGLSGSFFRRSYCSRSHMPREPSEGCIFCSWTRPWADRRRWIGFPALSRTRFAADVSSQYVAFLLRSAMLQGGRTASTRQNMN